jgi:protein gp37
MAETTNIAWCDSTINFWWGCTNVSPGCDHCYAETFDKRVGGAHWGVGAPRRKIASAVAAMKKLNAGAGKFFDAHGRKRRVFVSSMSDFLDNEVDPALRAEGCETMEECSDLNIMLLTKRGVNVPKLMPKAWLTGEGWPQHVGFMHTVCGPGEAMRIVPQVLRMKVKYAFPWTGLSMEPLLAAVDLTKINSEDEFDPFDEFSALGRNGFDFIIVGGESGPKRRPFNVEWAYSLLRQCQGSNTAFFIKQMSALHPSDDMIPPDLMVRQFPEALR